MNAKPSTEANSKESRTERKGAEKNGYEAAVFDMAEGWLDANSISDEDLASHLRMAVGASPAYIKGYTAAVREGRRAE